jgi:betaine reductase
VPALGIPYPLGDPKLPPEKEKKVRKNLVIRAVGKLGQG